MSEKGNKSNKKRKASPVKKQNSRISPGIDQSNLNENRVEIDHLQTTIIHLNQKVEIIEDMEHEVQTTRAALDNSDAQRQSLQRDIADHTRQMQKDSGDHQNYQDQLLSENDELRAQIR
jgi:hypothetical protein